MFSVRPFHDLEEPELLEGDYLLPGELRFGIFLIGRVV
jgi:hypothetical protein